jgi:uncharacterized damage-inducible protein DinB
MSETEYIQALFAYNEWANDHILSTAAQLDAEDFTRDLGASFGSVQGNLSHMLGAQTLWLSRWSGARPTRVTGDSIEALRGGFELVDSALRSFVDGLSDDDLGRRLSYTDTQGNKQAPILWQTLLHVANHGTHHRAEVALLLTALGKPPRQLDYMFFELERAGGPPRLT